MTSGRRNAALFGAAAFVLAACSEGEPGTVDPVRLERTAVERGAEAFVDASTSKHPFNVYSCSTCHAATEPSDRVRPGAPLAGVVARQSFWGGAEIDLLRAVNDCLVFFMLDDEPWRGDEPTAVALYAYLESLSGPGTPPR